MINRLRFSSLTILFLLLAFVLMLPAQSNQAQAQNPIPKIYWTDRGEGTLRRANLDGSAVEKLLQVESYENPRGLIVDMQSENVYFIIGFDSREIWRMDLNEDFALPLIDDYLHVLHPNSLAVDPWQNELVWTDSGFDAIGRAPLAGGDVLLQLAPGPRDGSGIAIDSLRSKIIWTDYGGLKISTLDGSNTQRFPYYYPGPGYSQMPMGLAVNEQAGQLYYTVATQDFGLGYGIVRVNYDGSDPQTLVADTPGRSAGLALDLAGGKMYWTESSTFSTIKRANLDGSAIEPVVHGLAAPYDLQLDPESGLVYWTDWSLMKIFKAPMAGGTAENVLSTAPYHPRNLIIDAHAGKLYWTTDGGDEVWWANLDGSAAAPLIAGSGQQTRGIVLDQASARIYWSNATAESIAFAPKQGGTAEELIAHRLYGPQGIVIDPITGLMFWADFETDKILSAGPFGQHYQELITEGLELPTAMALDPWQRQMVWADSDRQEIARANMDGSAVEVILDASDGLVHPDHIALDLEAGQIYWSDHGTHTISRANMDGSAIEVLLTAADGIDVPSGLALSLPPEDIFRIFAPVVSNLNP